MMKNFISLFFALWLLCGTAGEALSRGLLCATTTGQSTSTCVEGNDAYTVLLIHSNTTDGSTTFVDSAFAGDHTGDITVVGDTHHETDQQKFGTTSIAMDGTNDKLTIAASQDFNFGTGDFTIDFWTRLTVIDSPGFVLVCVAGNRTLEANVNNLLFANVTTYLDVAHGMAINTWYHIALVRYGNTVTIYVNGSSIGSADCTGATFDWSSDTLKFGDYNLASTYALPGYLDEIRVSKGIARWTANFTAPAYAYCD